MKGGGFRDGNGVDLRKATKASWTSADGDTTGEQEAKKIYLTVRLEFMAHQR